MNRSLLIVLVACGCLSVGCQSKAPKHYAISGEVISLDVPKETITVKHGEIPGLMPAMTMEYKVADVRQMERLTPGDTISADLVVDENVGHLEKIVLLGKASPAKATPVK